MNFETFHRTNHSRLRAYAHHELLSTSTRTLAIIKPEGLANLGGILDSVYKAGLRISQMQTSDCVAVADNPYFSKWCDSPAHV